MWRGGCIPATDRTMRSTGGVGPPQVDPSTGTSSPPDPATSVLPIAIPTMKRHTATVSIDRNPIEVFYFLDDVSREHEWQDGLKSAEQEPPGPSRVGSLKRYRSAFLGKDVRNTYRVVDVEPGRRLVTESTADSAVDARYEVRVEPDGTGARVTFTLEAAPRGPLKLLPRRLVETAVQKELAASLGKLKALLEG